ncbi:type II toxin-antitoxin system HicA family toxin [Rhodoferax sp.]|uniref:type II toxin-antitoxin system HicA family toxin n=1 Tax=Rhodoferax sp. TaxID=50421 RepID=UPI00261DE0A7|nr:type II toxin-antitoxin system HicA family toxin [Rhodoferax sp.]
MNSKHKKTLMAIFSHPLNGNLEWSRIESLLVGLGCQVIEGSGSSVTFEKDGEKVFFHRPHPGKEALRYRVQQTREFLNHIGVKP